MLKERNTCVIGTFMLVPADHVDTPDNKEVIVLVHNAERAVHRRFLCRAAV